MVSTVVSSMLWSLPGTVMEDTTANPVLTNQILLTQLMERHYWATAPSWDCTQVKLLVTISL